MSRKSPRKSLVYREKENNLNLFSLTNHASNWTVFVIESTPLRSSGMSPPLIRWHPDGSTHHRILQRHTLLRILMVSSNCFALYMGLNSTAFVVADILRLWSS